MVHYSWGFTFQAPAISSICCDNNVPTKVIVDNWEHGSITQNRHNGRRNTSRQTIRQVVKQASRLDKCIWRGGVMVKLQPKLYVENIHHSLQTNFLVQLCPTVLAGCAYRFPVQSGITAIAFSFTSTYSGRSTQEWSYVNECTKC